MNRIYQLIWSDVQQTWVVAGECTRARGKRSGGTVDLAVRSAAAALGLASAIASATPPAPAALPQGGSVVAGQAQITQNAATLQVRQTSAQAILAWRRFDIGAQAAVQFVQPGADAVALNRVVGPDPSAIFGRLSANGQVFLVNPNGVLFGTGAQVDVGGLVASTLAIGDADFLAGQHRFVRQGSTGAVVNQGTLQAPYVALLAPEVRNAGTIVASMGTAALAAGESVTLGITGHRLVDVQVDRATIDTLVENRHLVRVDGGTAVLTAQSAQALLGQVVNSGAVRADGIDASGGVVRLTASHAIHHSGHLGADGAGSGQGGTVLAIADLAQPGSRTLVDGPISARGGAAGGDGGFIETSANVLKIGPGTRIDTTAPNGSTGRWLLDPHDFTIAASGGDITGTTLSQALASSDVTIATADTAVTCSGTSCAAGTAAGNGDILVNDAVGWSSNRTLTLSAWRDVRINAPITVSGSGTLALALGQSGTTMDFPEGSHHVSAPVWLAAGAGFSTQLASDGAVINHTVIRDEAGLVAVAGNLSGSYVLGQDVAIGAWTPIGSTATPFAGSFDGLGHRVTGLTIAYVPGANDVGLFGGNQGLIQNLGVTGASVAGDVNVGALAGYNNGFIVNSHATGTVRGPTAATANTVGRIGGLVGFSMGPILQSYADVDVTATQGNQTGGDPLSSGHGGIGGLAGVIGGAVNNSYARGSVQGHNAVGGLVGHSAGSISASHATGAVSGSTHVAGLVGQVFDPGAFTPFIFDSYWDIETSGQASGGGGSADSVAGLSTAAMKNPANFTTWITPAQAWELRAGQYPLLTAMLQPVFLRANDLSTTYTGSAISGLSGSSTAPNGALTGAVGYATSTPNATNAGSYTITPVADLAAPGDQHGYRLVIGTGTATIAPAALTVTANNDGKTYDGVAYTGGAGVTYSGFVGTDTAAVLGGTLGYAGTSQGAVNAGSYTITPQGLSAGNYTLGFVNGTLTIDPAVLNIISGSLVGSTRKVYDGSNAVSGLTPANFSLSGWANGQGATVTKTTGSYTDGPNASASTTRPVSVTLQTADFNPMAGTDLSNYTLPTVVSGNIGEIARRPIAGTLTGTVSKVYDGTTTAAVTAFNYSYDVGNYVAGEGAYLAGSNAWQVGTFASKNVGSGQVVTVTIDPADYTPVGATLLSNYSFPTTVSGAVGTITPKAVTLTAPALSKVYDGGTAYTPTTADLAALSTQLGVAGDAVGGATLGFGDKHAGTGNKTTSFTAATINDGNGGANYSVTLASNSSSTITRKDVTLTYAGTNPVTKVYDGSTSGSVSVLDLAPEGFVSGERMLPTQDLNLFTGGLPATYDSKNAGSRTVTAALGAWMGLDGTTENVANYNLPTTFTTAAAITPKALTMAGTAVSAKTYDGTVNAAVTAGTLGGLLDGESLQLSATGSFDSRHAGARSVTVAYMLADGAGGTASNYAPPPTGQFASAITAKALTLTAPTVSKVYDGTTAYTANSADLAALSAQLGVAGDSVSGITLRYTDRHAAAGTKALNASAAVIADGQGGGNYTVAYAANGTSTITPRGVSLAPPAISKVYDGGTGYTASTADLADLSAALVGGDTVSAATLRFAGKDAGTGDRSVSLDAVTVQDGHGGANYTVTLGTGSNGSITPKALTISGSTAADKVYDGSAAATITAGMLAGLVGDERLGVTATGVFDSKDAGARVARASYLLADGDSGGLAANYRLADTAGHAARITPKALSISGTTARDKVYDGTATAPVIAGTLGGLVGTERLALTATGTFDSRHAGARAAQASYTLADGSGGGRAANYTAPAATTGIAATITPRSVTLTAPTVSKVYDGSTLQAASSANLAALSLALVAGDTVTAAALHHDTKDAGTRTVRLSDVVIADGLDGANYTVTYASNANGRITPKALTVNGTTVTGKVYDATTAATVQAGTLAGLVGNERLGLEANAAFDSKDAGTRQVTATYTLSDGAAGGLASNYTLPGTSSHAAAITPKLLAISGTTAADKVYDGTTAATITPGPVSGLVGNERLITTAVGNFDQKNAGARSATATYTLFAGTNGGLAGNYTLAPSAGHRATITPRPATMGGLRAENGFIDQPPLVTGTATVTDKVNGDDLSVQGTATWAYVNPKPNALVDVRIATGGYTLGGADALNYVLSQPTLKAALVERDLLKVVAAAVTPTREIAAVDMSNVFRDLGDQTGRGTGGGAGSFGFRLNWLREDLRAGRDPTKNFQELRGLIAGQISALCSRCTFPDSAWEAVLKDEKAKNPKRGG